MQPSLSFGPRYFKSEYLLHIRYFMYWVQGGSCRVGADAAITELEWVTAADTGSRQRTRGELGAPPTGGMVGSDGPAKPSSTAPIGGPRIPCPGKTRRASPQARHGQRQCQCLRRSSCSAARRAARVWSSPERRKAECGPSGRHHRRGTPLVSWVSSACRSVAFPAIRSRASSTCSTPMYGCSRRSASRSASSSSSAERRPASNSRRTRRVGPLLTVRSSQGHVRTADDARFGWPSPCTWSTQHLSGSSRRAMSDWRASGHPRGCWLTLSVCRCGKVALT
jgi:hypothetical protein